MKTLSIFLALVNSLLAGLILAFSLSPTEIAQTEAWWSLMRVTAASSVIFIGVLTWLDSARPVRAGLMAICTLFLVSLGAATIVWTLHLALVSCVFEYYLFLYGASLAIQGMASIFGFTSDSRNVTSI
jgi:hypothetical protein